MSFFMVLPPFSPFNLWEAGVASGVSINPADNHTGAQGECRLIDFSTPDNKDWFSEDHSSGQGVFRGWEKFASWYVIGRCSDHQIVAPVKGRRQRFKGFSSHDEGAAKGQLAK